MGGGAKGIADKANLSAMGVVCGASEEGLVDVGFEEEGGEKVGMERRGGVTRCEVAPCRFLASTPHV